MGFLMNVLGWIFLLMGLSMYKMRFSVAKEANVVVGKVVLTCYTTLIISVLMFLLGGLFW